MAAPAPASTHTLKVTLDGIKPPIWRRVRLPSELTLESLHHVIQTAMGWYDCHLHQFEIGGERYGVDDRELDMDVVDERSVTLHELAPKGTTFRYEYDFGDGWEHTIKVEEVGPADDRGPVCLAAKRACPPEDCGGPWGYPELLAILADPSHEEHDERVEWMGGLFDPEAVDTAEINRSLPKMR